MTLKSKIITIVSITLLLIIAVGIAVYFDLKNNSNNDDKTNAQTNQNTVEDPQNKPLTDTEIDTIEKRIYEYEYLLLDGHYYPSDIEKLEYNVFTLLFNMLANEMDENSEIIISKEALQKALQNYIGEYRPLTLPNEIEDGFCGLPAYIYNPQTGYYQYNEEHLGHGMGGYAYYDIHSMYLINSEQAKDKYIVDYKIVIREEYSGAYYGSTQAESKLIVLDNPESDDYYDRLREYEFTTSDYQKVKDQIDTTRFTFIKEGNNYILDSVKVIEKNS